MHVYATLQRMKTAAYDYLIHNRIANIDMLEILPLPSVRVVLANEKGVLIEHDGLFFLASEPGRAAEFLPYIARDLANIADPMVVLHNGELKEALEREYGFETFMAFYTAVYDSDQPIPYTLPANAEIRKLKMGHLDFVHEHYHTVNDRQYVRERIEDGMFGVFMNGEIAGFAGTHDERSMGLMEILPQYRRLGLAYALEAHLINHLLSLGRVPFGQVSVENEPSIALQKKVGLVFSDSVGYWLVSSAV